MEKMLTRAWYEVSWGLELDSVLRKTSPCKSVSTIKQVDECQQGWTLEHIKNFELVDIYMVINLSSSKCKIRERRDDIVDLIFLAELVEVIIPTILCLYVKLVGLRKNHISTIEGCIITINCINEWSNGKFDKPLQT